MTSGRLTSKSFVFLLLGSGAVLAGTTIGVFLALIHDLPQIRKLEDFTPPALTRIYSADNALLAELFVEKREPVSLHLMPSELKQAIIATEDRKFYRHSGVDLKGILRALLRDIRRGQFVEGASTITQQLAKTLFLNPRKTLMRKLREALLAFQLERRYTKDEILEFYLNQVYFGSGAYGVETAARLFFGKAVQNLTLAESALIAGMPKAPSRYSPLLNPTLALHRRNTVLDQMYDAGQINKSERDDARGRPLALNSRPAQKRRAPYFVDLVVRDLEQAVGAARLYRGGLTVVTSLSATLQKAAENAVQEGLTALQQRMKQRGLQSRLPQAALVAIDTASGGILALVGGRDYLQSPFNRAVAARRQPGSAFKPIVYAHAIEKGFPQNMLLRDSPVVFKGGPGARDWKPQNFSRTYHGEMTLRRALAISQNIPAVRLIERLGPASVAAFGAQLGIASPLEANLSLALGTSEVSLLELTSAYAVFANRGDGIKPWGIEAVRDLRGRPLWHPRILKRASMSRAGAAVVTDMLQAVVQEGTARRARTLRRPLAAKTGTTNDYRDALLIGFSPTVAAGVWVGCDDGASLGGRESGARAALPIWKAFMVRVLAERPYAYFDIPDDAHFQWMDPLSGAVVSESAPGAVRALFRK